MKNLFFTQNRLVYKEPEPSGNEVVTQPKLDEKTDTVLDSLKGLLKDIGNIDKKYDVGTKEAQAEFDAVKSEFFKVVGKLTPDQRKEEQGKIEAIFSLLVEMGVTLKLSTQVEELKVKGYENIDLKTFHSTAPDQKDLTILGDVVAYESTYGMLITRTGITLNLDPNVESLRFDDNTLNVTCFILPSKPDELQVVINNKDGSIDTCKIIKGIFIKESLKHIKKQ